jgi:cyclic pyranopterin phosphate synthase
MLDSSGREINYARVSITDRCNLRCVYCMPESGVEPMRHVDILSYENILRICKVFAAVGISRIKVTGGEPLVRRDAADLIGRLKRLEGISTVTLTTNGHALPEMAAKLRGAGLDGINISLDTLDPTYYNQLTRGGDVRIVLDGLSAALDAGIPVKVNCVPVNKNSERHVLGVAALARRRPVHVRFIEMMPIGPVGFDEGCSGVSNEQVREWLECEYGPLMPLDGDYGSGPARYASLLGFQGKIGFISALSDCFCESCNRIRLTSNGFIRTCLNKTEGVNLLPALADPEDDYLLNLISEAIWNKPERHNFLSRTAERSCAMSMIGG